MGERLYMMVGDFEWTHNNADFLVLMVLSIFA